MLDTPVSTAHADNAHIFHAAAVGVPWAQLLAWLRAYGFGAVLQVLPVILQGGLSGLTVAQIIAWVNLALAAVNAGQPLPPLPAPKLARSHAKARKK